MAGKEELSDNEGRLLALVARLEPTTTYQLVKVFAESPVGNLPASKGAIYPVIERLERLGMVVKERVKSDGRGTEQLRCTAVGRAALKQWVLQIRASHMLLDDPLRTKVQSFDLLEPEERAEWVLRAKQQLHHKLQELESYGEGVDVPFKELVHDHAVRSIRARMDWLDLLYLYVKRSDAA